MTKRSSWRQVGFALCAGIMVLSLAAQGVLLYARDGVTRDPLPWAFTITDYAWALLAVSFIFYFKKPVVTLIAGWGAFVIFALLLERFSDEHTFIWFLWRHSILLLFIAASHLGYLLKRKPVQPQAPL